jgi:hypothetical protein
MGANIGNGHSCISDQIYTMWVIEDAQELHMQAAEVLLVVAPR